MEVRIFNRKPTVRTVRNIIKDTIAELIPVKNDTRWLLFILNYNEDMIKGVTDGKSREVSV